MALTSDIRLKVLGKLQARVDHGSHTERCKKPINSVVKYSIRISNDESSFLTDSSDAQVK